VAKTTLKSEVIAAWAYSQFGSAWPKLRQDDQSESLRQKIGQQYFSSRYSVSHFWFPFNVNDAPRRDPTWALNVP